MLLGACSATGDRDRMGRPETRGVTVLPCLRGHFRSPSPATCVAGWGSLERCRPLRSSALHRPPADSSTPRTLRSAAHPTRAPSVGLLAFLFATSTGGVHCWRRLPRLSPDVPSAAFRTPSTVCSASGLAGLFHPAATSRISLQGFVPRREPHRISPAVALFPFRRSRLRFPAPSEIPSDSGPCSRCECGDVRNR